MIISSFGQAVSASLDIQNNRDQKLDFKLYLEPYLQNFQGPSPDEEIEIARGGQSFAPIIVKAQKQTEEIKFKRPVVQEKKINPNKKYPNVFDAKKLKINKTLNISLIGTYQSGKSTLFGQLLYQQGFFQEDQVRRNQRKDQESRGVQFAWLSDIQDQERLNFTTQDESFGWFQYQQANINLTDTPGRHELGSRVARAALQSDIPVLIINAKRKVFEKDLEQDQLKQLAFLARGCNKIRQLIICINQLDIWQDSQQRFDIVKQKLLEQLSQIIVEENCIFIPVSGLQGINVIENEGRFEWYQGPSLCQVLSSQQVQLDYQKPLRLAINDVFVKPHGNIIGNIVCCKVISGILKANDKIFIQPGSFNLQLKQMNRSDKKVTVCFAGDQVDLSLKNSDRMFESIYQSSVISGLKYPFIKATRLRIQGITGFISIPIHRKRILTVVANNQIKYCKILRLIESKRLIYSYQKFQADIEIFGSIFCENLTNIKDCGKIILMDEGQVLCVCMIREILEQ